MIVLWAAWVTFCFEIRRAMTLGRMALVTAMALFPAGLVGVVQWQGAKLEALWPAPVIMLFVLIPCMVSLLSLLIWATPLIQVEIEGRTWSYLAVRPGGKVPILLGKYAAALLFAVATAIVALSLAVIPLVAAPDASVPDSRGEVREHRTVRADKQVDWHTFQAEAAQEMDRPPARGLPLDKFFHLWNRLALLTVLSCLAYSALFALLGVLFLRRAMTVAVAYTFIFEFFAGLIPAIVNKFTVQYHLRSLLIDWFDLAPTQQVQYFRAMVGSGPPWQHILILLGMSAVLLTAAALVLRQRELVSPSET